MSMRQFHPTSLIRRVGQACAILGTAMAFAVSLEAQTVGTVLSSSGSQPVGVAVDWNQNFYYTLGFGNDPVSVYNPGTSELAPVVSAGTGGLISPVSFAWWHGGLVVADSGMTTLRFVDVNTGNVSSPWTNQWVNPSAVATDAAGNVFVGDWNGVYVLTPSNTVATLTTNVSRASALAVGETGKLWVADAANNVVKLLEISGGQVTNMTVIGKWATPGYVDSTVGTSALFNQPRGLLWVGGQTGLLVSDYRNNVIRNVAYSSSRKAWGVATWAAGFSAPLGLSRNTEGVTLVADSKSGQILSVTLPSQASPSISPEAGGYSNAVPVILTTPVAASSSPVFHYTLDGTAPTLLSTAGSAFVLDGTDTTVLARCFSPDYATSSVLSNRYTFFVATPAASPAGAASDNDVSVALSTVTDGARIYWTMDGSEPSPANGTLYQSALNIKTSGVLKYAAFKSGYTNSQVASNVFTLTTATPVISPQGATATDSLLVTLTSSTVGATIYWTIDGTEPTTNSLVYTKPFVLSKTGTLKARAFRDGYITSAVSSADFNLTVASPVIDPAGYSGFNSVRVILGTMTSQAALYWTMDGSEPSPANGALYTGPFDLATAGTLKVKGFRDGFASSSSVSADFDLTVAQPSVDVDSGTYINSVAVTLHTATTGAAIRYTLDGTMPTKSSPLYEGTLLIETNATLTAVAYRDGFTASSAISRVYQIKVDKPVISPASGYYPNGVTVTLSVQRNVAGTAIYYTSDGTVPTTNSTRYTGPFRVSKSGLAEGNMSMIRACAFAPNTISSDVAEGSITSESTVGVPRDMVAGIGSTIVVPVVADMAAGQKLRSLQFRFEIAPYSPGTPALESSLEALNISTNDFIPVVIQSSDTNSVKVSWSSYTHGVTNGAVYASIATNLLVTNYSMLMSVKVKIPAAAWNGDVFTLHVTGVSGTSDGSQQTVPLIAMPDRYLTIQSLPYMAGDCAGGDWYNAGDFGDGSLNNADVNAVFLASVGIHAPIPFTDAFNAMDIYPETDNVIGNGLITYLDWQHLLRRSIGLETNSWVRWWGTGGVLCHSNLTGISFPVTRGLRANTLTTTATNQTWLRHALVAGDTVANAQPGTVCSIPVYVHVLSGFELAGLQFAASLEPQGGAPEVTKLGFTAAGGMVPSPSTQLLPAANHLACAWSLNTFGKPLQGSNLLGYVTFTVPADSAAGQSYVLRISHPGGAADEDTELDFESAPGQAWVLSTPASIAPIVSDEWKTNYFGSLTSSDADSMADPDKDGVPNWQEYLAGTSPVDATSKLQFSRIDVSGNNASILTLQWQTLPGRVYTVETTSDLTAGAWTTTGQVIEGNGTTISMYQTNLTGKLQFYRLRLQKP